MGVKLSYRLTGLTLVLFVALSPGPLVTWSPCQGEVAEDPELVRDVFLLLDRGPIHMRLRISIAGKSPQAVRREYLTRLFRLLDADGNGKLSRAEFERSPLNTSRRGPTVRPLSAKEAAETVSAAKLNEALERVAGETLA